MSGAERVALLLYPRRGGAGLPDKPWRVSILLFPFHSVLCWRDVGKWRLNYIYPRVLSASSLMVGAGNRLAGLYFFLAFSSVLCLLETGNKKEVCIMPRFLFTGC